MSDCFIFRALPTTFCFSRIVGSFWKIGFWEIGVVVVLAVVTTVALVIVTTVVLVIVTARGGAVLVLVIPRSGAPSRICRWIGTRWIGAGGMCRDHTSTYSFF